MSMKFGDHKFDKHYTPEFLMHTKRSPTVLISPAKYKMEEAFNASQMPKRDFKVL